MTKSTKRIHQMTFADFEALFPNEDACRDYLAKHRWPAVVRCPRCGDDHCYALESRPHHWECMNCASGHAYRFSVTVGTVFENTNKPLRDWFRVIHLMMTSKKGVSALQIHRQLGFGSYKTAWSMCHRVRAGLADEEFTKLMGIVEVDETYIGGKAHNRHGNKRDGKPGGTGSGKTAVIGAVSRKGNVVARVIDNVRTSTIKEFLSLAVSDKVSLLVTDTLLAYKPLGAKYPHKTINHAADEYVVGALHTQTIEGFWSMIKRGVVGTFHKVSRKYLPLYIAEFQFRYNNRANADIFGAAVKGM